MSDSEYKGISVFTDKGFMLPDAYAQRVIQSRPTAYGCAVPDGKGGLQIEHAQSIDLRSLREAEKAFENFHVLHFFGHYPKNPIAGSIQPFPILKNHASNKAILAGTLVGDFSPHDKAGSKLPGTTWAYTKLLSMFQRIWRLCGEDINKLHEELKIMDGEIKDLIGMQGGGINLFLAKPENSVVFYFGKAMPTYKKYPWGTTTDTLGYVTGIAVPDKPAPDLSALEEDDDEDVSAVPAVKPKEEQAPAAKKDTPTEGKDKGKSSPEPDKLPIIVEKPQQQVVLASGGIAVQISGKDGKDVWMYHAPQQITKRKHIKRALKEACGRDVSDREADDRVAVIIRNPNMLEEISKRLKDIQAIGSSSPVGSDAPRTKATETKAAPAEESDKKAVTSVHEEREKEYPPGGTPIYSSMSPKAKYDITKSLKALDKSGQSVMNPALNQELENTSPQFYKDIGYPGLEQTLGWDWDTRVLLAKHSPEAMAIWSGDLIRMIQNLTKDIESLTDPDVMKDRKRQVA